MSAARCCCHWPRCCFGDVALSGVGDYKNMGQFDKIVSSFFSLVVQLRLPSVFVNIRQSVGMMQRSTFLPHILLTRFWKSAFCDVKRGTDASSRSLVASNLG